MPENAHSTVRAIINNFKTAIAVMKPGRGLAHSEEDG